MCKLNALVCIHLGELLNKPGEHHDFVWLRTNNLPERSIARLVEQGIYTRETYLAAAIDVRSESLNYTRFGNNQLGPLMQIQNDIIAGVPLTRPAHITDEAWAEFEARWGVQDDKVFGTVFNLTDPSIATRMHAGWPAFNKLLTDWAASHIKKDSNVYLCDRMRRYISGAKADDLLVRGLPPVVIDFLDQIRVRRGRAMGQADSMMAWLSEPSASLQIAKERFPDVFTGFIQALQTSTKLRDDRLALIGKKHRRERQRLRKLEMPARTRAHHLHGQLVSLVKSLSPFEGTATPLALAA